MEETKEITPELEAKETQTEATEVQGDTLEVLHEKEDAKQTVGLDKFLEVKNEAKELRRELQELNKKIQEGASKRSVDDDIASLSREYNVDETLLQKIAQSVTSRTTKEIEERLMPKLAKVEEMTVSEKREKTFNNLLSNALDVMPEYDGVINKEVIKTLAFDPRNSKKTITQIIEETYGNAITGKKSFETKRGSGREPEKPDFNSIRGNPNLLKEVLKDESQRKEFNSELEKRLLS